MPHVRGGAIFTGLRGSSAICSLPETIALSRGAGEALNRQSRPWMVAAWRTRDVVQTARNPFSPRCGRRRVARSGYHPMATQTVGNPTVKADIVLTCRSCFSATEMAVLG